MYTEMELLDSRLSSNNFNAVNPTKPCSHIYNPKKDDSEYHRSFEDLPDTWCCPECGSKKEYYIKQEK